MPESAIQTGLVDFILEPDRMPERLIEYFRDPETFLLLGWIFCFAAIF
jgi:chemotaxis response regulator CheB